MLGWIYVSKPEAINDRIFSWRLLIHYFQITSFISLDLTLNRFDIPKLYINNYLGDPIKTL